MTIEVSILLAAISVSAALYFGIKTNRRSQKKEDKDEASQDAIVITKLESIEKGVDDIKEELKGVKADVKEDHDRIIRLEESSKQAHKRIDELKRKKQGDVSE